jgi:hypothetical protein
VALVRYWLCVTECEGPVPVLLVLVLVVLVRVVPRRLVLVLVLLPLPLPLPADTELVPLKDCETCTIIHFGMPHGMQMFQLAITTQSLSNGVVYTCTGTIATGCTTR